MTTAEALAAVREALSKLRYSNEQPNLGKALQAKDALAALALIEQRLEERTKEIVRRDVRLKQTERRVAELEAALRFYGQASDASLLNDAGRIARRALNPGRWGVTTAEALAVVREALDAPDDPDSPFKASAHAALALIEERVGEMGKIGSDGLPTCNDPDCTRDDHIIGYLRARAEKAEAERDEARRRFSLEELERLEQRVAEFEAALREIDVLDRRGHDSHIAADMGYIARRALERE